MTKRARTDAVEAARKSARPTPRSAPKAWCASIISTATRAAAACTSGIRRRRAWYTPEWGKRMEAAFGARPTVTYYDNHVVVDNETRKVKIEGEG